MTLLDNDLPVFLAAAVVVGVVVVGPRDVLRSWWLVAGTVIAVSLWAPYLVWQAQHGWPQLAISRAIANGSSGTSAPRWQIPVQQLYLASPPLVPVWVAGLVRLARSESLRWARSLAVAYVVLLIVFVVTGGKPYYLANSFPLLLAAGSQPTIAWLRRHVGWRRVWWPFIAVGAAISVVITLPVVPVSALHDTPIVAVNYDAGETVAWPTYVVQIAAAARRHPTAVLLTSNYGEAGALQRYGSAYDLPPVFGVQNAYWLWGPPAPTATTALVVGIDRSQLAADFRTVTPVGRLNNHLAVDDDEQDEVLYDCSGLRRPWRVIWPRLKDYG